MTSANSPLGRAVSTVALFAAAFLSNGAPVPPLSVSLDAATTTLTVETTSLASTRIGEPYSAALRASGGSGVYRWSIAAGALPAGLTLDSALGAINGTAAVAGRFNLTVRATDTLDLTTADRPLALSVLAAAPPSVYDAVTDRLTRDKGTLPVLGPAGFTFTDPVFGTRLARLTDGTLRPAAPGRSYRTPSSTHANAWSADGRYFYAVSTDGTVIPFTFDRTTMTAGRLQPSTSGDGGLTLRFFNEPTFSYVTPGVAYGTYNGSGANLRSVDAYDFETGLYSSLLNLDTLAPNLAGTYTGGVDASAGPVEKLIAFFGGTGQDRHFYLVVFDRNDPAQRHLVDTVASTVDGAATNIPLNFKIHAAAIDRSGQYVTIYPTGADLQAPRSAAPAYVWDTRGNTFTATPLVEAVAGGHDAYGFGYRVNQDCCTTTTWDAAQWQFRSLATPLVTSDLVTPVLLPKEVYLADHPSWHNAQPDRLVPFIDANYRYGTNTTAWRAWDEEIFAVQTDGAGSGALVWRFGHHRSAVANDLDASRIAFWYTPRANVSPDGQWALFTSNWEKTLGTDPGGESGTGARQDVFLIELAPTAAPALAPVVIGTTTVPGATATQAYADTLQASGGSGTYVWSVAGGALPAGLTLAAATGVISGTPSAAGTASFTVLASDAANAASSASQALTITVAAAPAVPVSITTTALADGLRGVPYRGAISTSGGLAPLAWSVAAGALPPGLTLNPSTGAISGTPSKAGLSSFTVRVTDSALNPNTATKALSIRVKNR